MTRPVIAIVGRPNVGKSSLLNRIVGRFQAITEDSPGTTRDRNMAEVTWRGVDFTVVDTGGLEPGPDTAVGRGIQDQIEAAITEADVIIDLVDVKDGVTPADIEVADILRRRDTPVLVVVNKADNDRMEAGAPEFYELGLGEPLPVSAHHGRGVAELLDHAVALLPGQAATEPETDAIKVAIVGRPNVGKSMLLNSLVKDSRAIVDHVPGTTRDAVDTRFDFEGRSVLLIDTAGIRRRGRVRAGVERYSVIRTFKAIDRADIALLVLDATEMVTGQDTHVAGYIQQAARGIIIIVNKWDLIEEKDVAAWDRGVREQLKFAAYAPVVFTSARTGRGVDEIMPRVIEVHAERQKRLPTSRVNNVIQDAFASHTRPRSRDKQLKIFYATQAEIDPPTFVFFTNDARLVHFSYKRYLENRLRREFGFTGTPLRMIFKTRGEA